MPKNSTKNEKRTVIASTVVQLSLLPEVVEQLMTVILEKNTFFDDLCEVLEQGYSLTIQYDADREQFSARLAGIEERCPNAGKLLYGNGKQPVHALLALYGKHFLAAKGGLWQEVEKTFSLLS